MKKSIKPKKFEDYFNEVLDYRNSAHASSENGGYTACPHCLKRIWAGANIQIVPLVPKLVSKKKKNKIEEK